MSEYDNTNTGALFKNDKAGNDKRPDYKGSVNADGVEYWLSSWITKSKSGQTFMSLKLERKDAEGGRQAPAAKDSESYQKQLDDIPF